MITFAEEARYLKVRGRPRNTRPIMRVKSFFLMAMLALVTVTLSLGLSGCALSDNSGSQEIEAPTDRMWEIHERTLRDFTY